MIKIRVRIISIFCLFAMLLATVSDFFAEEEGLGEDHHFYKCLYSGLFGASKKLQTADEVYTRLTM